MKKVTILMNGVMGWSNGEDTQFYHPAYPAPNKGDMVDFLARLLNIALPGYYSYDENEYRHLDEAIKSVKTEVIDPGSHFIDYFDPDEDYDYPGEVHYQGYTTCKVTVECEDSWYECIVSGLLHPGCSALFGRIDCPGEFEIVDVEGADTAKELYSEEKYPYLSYSFVKKYCKQKNINPEYVAKLRKQGFTGIADLYSRIRAHETLLSDIQAIIDEGSKRIFEPNTQLDSRQQRRDYEDAHTKSPIKWLDGENEYFAEIKVVCAYRRVYRYESFMVNGIRMPLEEIKNSYARLCKEFYTDEK